jgi:TonB family protein
MSTLIIKRHHQNSASGSETKIYRFAMEQGHLTVGSSRKADLRLPKASALQIEGIFEIGPKGWEYHSFSMTTEDSNLIIPVSHKTKIKIGDVTLEAEVSAERSRFSNSAAEAGTNTSNLNKQIILVYLRNKLAMSFTDLPNRKTNIEVYGRKIELNTVLSAKWVETMDGEFLIRQKSVEETDIKTFALPLKDLLPKEKQDQWIGGAIALTFLLAIVGSFVGPAPQEFVAENEAPKVTAPVLVKLTPPRQQVAQSKADQQIELKPGKASAALDRIKGLTAKISAKAGAFLEKSARMPSAIGPNGSGNAAAMGVGRLGGSSTDWNKMAGSKVAGQVGGSLSGGTGGGQLAAGATGASGVGLLEEEGDVSTGLDRELIAALIRKNIGHILYCYERSLSANPNLFGKVSVRFVIGASGKVETQKIGESTLRDGRVENCILDKVANWKFPEPKGGVQVVVTYPFLFKTTN